MQPHPPPFLSDRAGGCESRSIRVVLLSSTYHAEIAIPQYSDQLLRRLKSQLSFVYSDVRTRRSLPPLSYAEWRLDACFMLVSRSIFEIIFRYSHSNHLTNVRFRRKPPFSRSHNCRPLNIAYRAEGSFCTRIPLTRCSSLHGFCCAEEA